MTIIPRKRPIQAIQRRAHETVSRLAVPRLGLRAGTYAVLVLLAVIEAFPLVWMLITAVKERREVFDGSFLPSELRLDNFPRVWAAIDAPTHLVNSLIVTGMTIAVVVTVATLAGYAFARLRFRGNDVLFYVFLLSMIIPGQVTLIPLFIYVKDIGLLNTLPGLAIAYLGGALPFAIFLLRAFFRTLPGELRDAALIDGCNEFGVFRRVYLPLARPGVATVIIFQFLFTWNEFMFATTFMSTPQMRTIQSALYTAVGRYSTDWPALCAGVSIAILPVIGVYLLLQRQFQRGLTAGAIKG
jgi:ABC-type glycerol-3-phosphate transport system permease component